MSRTIAYNMIPKIKYFRLFAATLFFIPSLSAQDINGFIILERNSSGDNTYLISAGLGGISGIYENNKQGIRRSTSINKSTFSALIQTFHSLDLKKYETSYPGPKDSDYAGHYFIAQMTLDEGTAKSGLSYLIPVDKAPSNVLYWISKYKEVVAGKAVDTGNKKQSDAAIRAATAWFKLIDKGHYEKSWEGTSSLTKSMLKKHQWVEMVSFPRKQFGAIRKRTLLSAKYNSALPKPLSADGEYVSITYDSDFSKRPSLREIILIMKSPNSTWKVIDYFVVIPKQNPENDSSK